MALDRALVEHAYRLFLGRAGGAAEIDHMVQYTETEAELRRVFLGSAEFNQATTRLSTPLDHYFCEFDAQKVLDRFAQERTAEPGVVVNFIGAKVKPRIHPERLDVLTGTVEARPDPGNWHADIAEWAAALRSVELAQGLYRIIELGCGWGCWISNMGVAARARGLDVDLVGIEGDRTHLANAYDTLALNGFEKKEYRLYHGIAGPYPGKAIFPDPEPGTAHWAGEPEFYPNAERLAEAGRMPGLQILDCMTLDQLAGGGDIDLLHIDIQGGEADYVDGNNEAMERLVRRVLIGTHSRVIEGRLFDHFIAHGWRLEMERPAITPPENGIPIVRIDGVQLWANPRLT